MNIGLKEIKRNKSKYGLIIGILILLIFMVLFLSGLANGLSKATSALIENADGEYYVISEDADTMLTRSTITPEQLELIEKSTINQTAALNLQRTTMVIQGEGTKLDITYLAVDPEDFMMLEVSQGDTLSEKTTALNEIVLDSSFQEEGIEIGDSIVDTTSEIELKVVGFSEDALYSHSPVGVISTATYTAMKTAINPEYSPVFHGVAIAGDDIENIKIEGTTILSKEDLIAAIPGHAQEQTTINMILWVLVFVSAAILGVFFYVITIQKLSQFGVLKALGMGMNSISGMVIGQVFFLAAGSMLIGNVLTFGLSTLMPESMPFTLPVPAALTISAAFIVISVLCSLLSLIKVAKVDPLITIGGNE